jgi:hypothetical protein
VFETDLNREILKGARGQEFKLRTPMGRFGQGRRARRRRGLSRVRRGQLRHRSADRRGRRIPAQRSESVNPAIVISAEDNVATALERSRPGQTIQAGGVTVQVTEAIPRGHKVALRRSAQAPSS